jgi:hypothetical protein
LDDLLAESVEHAIEREQTEFDRQAGPCAAAIVLFGAARMGQLLLSGLRRAGIEPLAFADNNPAMWGRSLNGIPVLSPIDAAYRFGDSAVFVIAIWGRGASDPMRTREARLRELGCRRVVSFGPLLWKYAFHFLPRIPALDLPHKVLQQAGDIQAAFDHLADDWMPLAIKDVSSKPVVRFIKEQNRPEFSAFVKPDLDYEFMVQVAPGRPR